jgi:O-antigen/teichoic acid export membrane protein
MVTLFSMALRQSLLPAFAQLSQPEKRPELEMLVKRGVRLFQAVAIPGLVSLCVIARPFFTIWAGKDFGRESTLPFFILAIGLFFSLMAYVPHSTILARGRTDVFARLYWMELLTYAVLASVLVYEYGIIGAAVAWTVRVIVDSVVVVILAKRITHISFGFVANGKPLAWSLLIMLPLVAVAVYDNFSPVLIFLTPVCLSIYSIFMWRSIVDETERGWIKSRLPLLFG